MFKVISWDSGKTLASYESLKDAKKHAKGLGHTGEDVHVFTGYPPVAYVGNENGYVVYNPRFRKAKAK